jgi:hypothetical protein
MKRRIPTKEATVIGKVGLTALSYATNKFSGLDDFIKTTKTIGNLTAGIVTKLTGVLMSQDRESFLAQGSQFLQEVLGEQAEYQTKLKKDSNLVEAIQSNIDILSDEIVGNSKLSQPVKFQIEKYKEEVRQYILMTAALIEKDKFGDIEQVVSELQVGENEKRRIELLLSGYKKMSFSMETIRVTVDFFSIVNKSIVQEVSSAPRDSSQFSDLMLKNAVLVYELTGFLIEYLEEFGIAGIQDIEQVRKDIENQLDQTERAIREIESDKNLDANPDLKEQVLRNNLERREILAIIRGKWSSFGEGINKNRESVNTTLTNLIPNLKIRQKDARIQIMTLGLVALTKAFQSNIDLANKFADVKELELAPLTADDVRQLLGLDGVECLVSQSSN